MILESGLKSVLMSSSTHPLHVHTLEPIQRQRSQLIDVAPIAGKTGQSAAAARDIAGLGGVVSAHVVKRDRQRGFFVEDVEAGDDEFRFVSLFNEWANGLLSLVGEGDGSVPRRSVELFCPEREQPTSKSRTRK